MFTAFVLGLPLVFPSSLPLSAMWTQEIYVHAYISPPALSIFYVCTCIVALFCCSILWRISCAVYLSSIVHFCTGGNSSSDTKVRKGSLSPFAFGSHIRATSKATKGDWCPHQYDIKKAAIHIQSNTSKCHIHTNALEYDNIKFELVVIEMQMTPTGSHLLDFMGADMPCPTCRQATE